MPVIEIREDGMSLDLLCHRFYGRTAGTVERALGANPGLAARGLVLPAGSRLLLPEAPPAAAARPTVNLWD